MSNEQKIATTAGDDSESPPICWTYPEPRSGFLGMLDRFLGPGTTGLELFLQLGFSLVAAVAEALILLARRPDSTGLQLAVATLLAFDLVGGVVTNASSSAKRWYHRQGQGAGAHFGFVAVHVVHIFLVSWLFRGLDWTFFGLNTALLLGSAVIVLLAPVYVRRPLAFGLLVVTLFVSLYALRPTVGLEWFMPVLFLKLDVAHLVREEPYRPVGES